MATFLGTFFSEIISPLFVSPTVFRFPFSFPSAAADFINAGGGNDFVNGGGGADTVFGGDGDDTLTGGSGAGASVSGGNGNDLIFQVNGTPEFIDGGAGVDTLNTTAFGGNYLVNLTTGLTNFAGESFINMENLVMGVGNDTLIGTAGANLLDGGAGNDSVVGGGGADTVIGGTGNDTLTGGFGGGASVFGGDGNDLIFQVNGTPESINGGNGVDTLNTTAFGGNYLVNLTTGLTNFGGESFVNMENLVMGVGIDTLIGTAGANLLDGGAGNDSLVGGQGRDVLTGGAGDDVFDYNATSESVGATRDLITAFEFSASNNPNDKIDLRTIDANPFLLFNQAFSTVEGTGLGQLSFTDLANGNTLIQGNTDFDVFAELAIEVADGATSAAFWSPSLDFFL